MVGERHSIAGVRFDFLNFPEVLDRIAHHSTRKPLTVALVNPHTVMNCRRRPNVREAIASSDLVLPDGVGISLAARLLHIPQRTRIPGPSLMLYLCAEGRRCCLRHYFYGGGPGVAQRLAERLTAAFPGLEVAGLREPSFFRERQENELDECCRINSASPDIVWVGLGAPKQEMWMARNVSILQARAVIGVGAAFDFHSGNVPWAPFWVRSLGLEWLFRLSKEPARLWRRNLDSPLFLLQVLRDTIPWGRAS